MALMHEPEFNVEKLLRGIREGSARRRMVERLVMHGGSASHLASATAISVDRSEAGEPAATQIDIPPLALQPSFEPHTDASYNVNELLQYHDRNFIQNAYRAILKRGPDATGYKAFIESLRDGRLNKIDILARLRFSSEGRAKQVKINGLLLPALVRQSYRIPLLGYLLNLCIALARFPSMIRSQQQFEAHVLAQHEQFAEHINHIGATLITHAKETASALTQSSEAIQRLTTLSESAQKTAASQQQQLDQLTNEQQAIVASQQAMIASQQAARDEVLERFITLQGHLKDLQNRLDELQGHLETRVDEEASERRQQLELLSVRSEEIDAQQREQIERLARSLTTETQRVSQSLRAEIERTFQKQQQLRSELILQGQRVNRLLEEASKRLPAPFNEEQLQALADEEQHGMDAFYVSFEDQFRGSRTQIKERLKVYLPLIERAGIGTATMPLLDVGCGRGEWLELLKDEGLRASGVDFNRVLVAQCRERGLQVIEADVLDYLRDVADESLGAVTGFHIVEHLPIEILIRLLDETMRVTKPGGAVIFETPNPQNVLVGSCNFYFDPTHRNPLPSPIMRFLIESRGFSRVRVINLNPSDAERVEGDTDLVKRFNEYFYGPMDYAVIGWKAGGQATGDGA